MSMMVYGDRCSRDDPRALCRELLADCAEVARGGDAHDAAMRVFVASSELAQGLVDHAFALRGDVDDLGPFERLAARLTLAAARLLLGRGLPRDVAEVVHEVLRAALPADVRVRVPEGFALYGLRPQAYAQAARLAAFERPVVVIGLRSIGAGLAAVVAAACGSGVPPVTLRPVGHPFAREVRVGPALERFLRAPPPGALFAVVDEGPGLSGSSLNAVADWLERRGLHPQRVRFFPHHGGELGPQSSPAHRARWARAARHVAPFDPVALLGGPLEDLSAGRWRAHLFEGPSVWPAVHAQQERLKYLSGDGERLFKFAGLGRYGDAALERSRALEAAGFGAPTLGLVRGFLVQAWLRGARPLPVAGAVDRRMLVRRAMEYAGLVSRGLPRAPRSIGAAPDALLAMARHNVSVALGPQAAAALERWAPLLPRLAAGAHPVATDGRCHAWEWLVLRDGRLLKTDGIDHHAGHDLVGCQDVAWDVAGLTVELGLDPDERGRVARAAGRHDEAALGFHEDCYLAFHLGRCLLAARAAAGREAVRLDAEARRYAARLERSLGWSAAA